MLGGEDRPSASLTHGALGHMALPTWTPGEVRVARAARPDNHRNGCDGRRTRERARRTGKKVKHRGRRSRCFASENKAGALFASLVGRSSQLTGGSGGCNLAFVSCLAVVASPQRGRRTKERRTASSPRPMAVWRRRHSQDAGPSSSTAAAKSTVHVLHTVHTEHSVHTHTGPPPHRRRHVILRRHTTSCVPLHV